MFLEGYARLLLFAHAIVSCALVASATHLVVWAWPRQGRYFAKAKGCARFAKIIFALYCANMALGLLIYPTYRVQVREELLDRPRQVAAISDREFTARTETLAAYGRQDVRSPHDPMSAVANADKTVKWFDVKEHWVALGLPLSLFVMVAIGRRRKSFDVADAFSRWTFAAVIVMTSIVWLAALVGLATASAKAVG